MKKTLDRRNESVIPIIMKSTVSLASFETCLKEHAFDFSGKKVEIEIYVKKADFILRAIKNMDTGKQFPYFDKCVEVAKNSFDSVIIDEDFMERIKNFPTVNDALYVGIGDLQQRKVDLKRKDTEAGNPITSIQLSFSYTPTDLEKIKQKDSTAIKN